MDLETGRVYQITYKCIDIGYGVEQGDGEFIYRGVVYDKHQLDPVDGSDPLYLFDDEITHLAKS